MISWNFSRGANRNGLTKFLYHVPAIYHMYTKTLSIYILNCFNEHGLNYFISFYKQIDLLYFQAIQRVVFFLVEDIYFQ